MEAEGKGKEKVRGFSVVYTNELMIYHVADCMDEGDALAAAYWHLGKELSNFDKQYIHVSRPEELEGDTGFCITFNAYKSNLGEISGTVYLLYKDWCDIEAE